MTSNPPPEPAPESNAALWLAVGRLQSDTARLIEGQSEIRTDLSETNRRIDGTNGRINETNRRIDGTNGRINETNQRIDGTNGRIDETNRRMDRLFYAIIGVGAGIIASLVALLLRVG